MIISASRRTDIPAYFGQWFINRINEGFLYTRNPRNYHQVSKIKLAADVVDSIVFWTKKPAPFMKYLQKLDSKGFNYYFQFTLTPYDKSIEVNLPDKERIIDSFIELSEAVGKDRVIWRYDPIVLTEKMTIDYHIEKFNYMLSRLCGYTEKCVISFLDMYSDTQKNMAALQLKPISESDIKVIGKEFAASAMDHNISLETCAEKVDLSSLGISHGRCIDDRLISEMLNKKIDASKDKNQRQECGCITSTDIGVYNTCMNGCSYCYANFNKAAVKNNFMKHDVNSPFLIGNLMEDDKITDKKQESYISKDSISKPISFSL